MSFAYIVEQKLINKIKSVDKNRQAFNSLISSKEWGNKENYDLSRLEIVTEIIYEFEKLYKDYIMLEKIRI